MPVKPPPIASQSVSEADLTDISAAANAAALEEYRGLRAGPAYMPPSMGGSLVVPGFHGGATWAGASFDPTTNLLYVNSNNLPNVVTLREASAGERYAYTVTGYNRFLDPESYPAVKPPWGLLTAVDLERDQPDAPGSWPAQRHRA